MIRMNLQIFASGSGKKKGGRKKSSGRKSSLSAAARRFASRTSGVTGRDTQALGRGRYRVSASNMF